MEVAGTEWAIGTGTDSTGLYPAMQSQNLL